MNAICSCNHCSNQIEFEANAAGQSVACPHCGGDIVLYVSPSQPSVVRTQADPGAIYADGDVKVSRTLLTVGLATYPIAAISSMRIVVIEPNEPNKSKLHWASTFAGFFLFMGAIFTGAELIPETGHARDALKSLPFWAIGIFLTFIALNQRKKLTPPIASYGLCITTTAQEQNVLTSPSHEALRPVESALHQAISMRG